MRPPPPQNPWTPLAPGTRQPATAAPAFTPPQLDAIAGWSRALNLCILGVIVLALFVLPTDFGVLAIIAAGILQFIPVFGLANAMRMRAAVLWAILSLIPYLGLIPLLVVSRKSTALLRQSGYRVGFMGAKRR